LVAALAPEDTATHNNLGISLRNLGKREAAIRAFEAAIERKPDYLSARYNLGTTLGELGRSKQALDQFAAIFRLAPEHVDARFSLGEILIDTGYQASAARHLSIYLSLDPTDRFGAAMRLARIGLAPFGLAHHPSLADAGCFAHGSEYVKFAAERAGLRLLSCHSVTHEKNADEIIPGLVVTAERYPGL